MNYCGSTTSNIIKTLFHLKICFIVFFLIINQIKKIINQVINNYNLKNQYSKLIITKVIQKTLKHEVAILLKTKISLWDDVVISCASV